MTLHGEKYKDSTETKVEVGFLRWRSDLLRATFKVAMSCNN